MVSSALLRLGKEERSARKKTKALSVEAGADQDTLEKQRK